MNTDPNETWLRSYLYVRIAMVGLLVALGVAVGFQTWHQGGELLSSVSAYYYTPAQGIFVGSLIGLGACMIALRGTTEMEDVLLNIGGMFAPIVAVVPTARGADYDTAVQQCKEGGELPTGLSCPDVQALADATRANVQNNMVALLVLGGLGIAITIFLFRHDKKAPWLAIIGGAAVYGAVLAAFVLSLDWFVASAHYLAALGLLLSIIAVALVNRRRHRMPGAQVRLDRYGLLAWALIIAAIVAVPLWFSGVNLFWLEIGIAALFACFWIVQTYEQRPGSPTAVTPMTPDVPTAAEPSAATERS
ncbi:hypothetical protein [Dactylosporangium sp. CS-033363]|uniref:hypothetical protein n=1 Tax=Dactylosporangium sp. CS-033363 TaxID=3239935 RepID=UPI003D8F8C34